MPDDCGDIERRLDVILMKTQFSERVGRFSIAEQGEVIALYKSYKPVCPYCRTNPVKDLCVNCGAPQENQQVKKSRPIQVHKEIVSAMSSSLIDQITPRK